LPHVIKFDTVGDFENNTFADPRILMIITELRIWFCIACINHKRDDHPLLKLFIIINQNFGKNKAPLFLFEHRYPVFWKSYAIILLCDSVIEFNCRLSNILHC